jgi:alpha-tubulin suppressor-like RCC1 family protein
MAVLAALVLMAAPLGAAGEAVAAPGAGVLWSWGSNSFGQLGNGATSTSPAPPAAVSGLSDVVDVHGGREHVAALTSSGSVFTWGSNVEGQLGLGDAVNRSRPTRVTVPCAAGQVTAVETGHNSTLATAPAPCDAHPSRSGP